MTVNSTYTPSVTNGNGVTTSFPVAFEVQRKADLLVYELDAANVKYAKVLDTDYTVNLTGAAPTYSAATVIMNVAPAIGRRLVRERNVLYKQDSDYVLSDPAPADTVEGDFDRSVMLTQQLLDNTRRSPKLLASSTQRDVNIEDFVDQKVNYYDAATNTLKVGPTVTDISGANASAIAAAASAASALSSKNSADADVVLTHADVVLTHADVVLTHADVVTATTQAGIATTQAGNASTSASSASTSATTATTQAGIATTQAGNASTSASSASTSATTATTQAGIATTQAGIATTQAGIATTQAGNASTSATNASNSEAAAATSAASGASKYAYSSTVTMASPGTGTFRLNNATIASVTALAIMNTTGDSGNPDIGGYINVWDDSTHTPRGFLILKKVGAPATFAIFSITGAVTDNTTWKQVVLTYVTGAGAFTNADNFYISFVMAGNDGTGTGDFSGPASSTDGEIVRFNGTGGKTGKQTGAATVNNTLGVGGVLTVNLNANNAASTPISGSSLVMVAADATAIVGMFDAYGATTGISGRRANGTQASKTGLVNGNTIFTIAGHGYNSSGAYFAGSGVAINLQAQGTWSNTSSQTRIGFATCPSGSTSPVDRFFIVGDGSFVANTLSDTGVAGSGNFTALYLNNTAFTAATQAEQEAGSSTAVYVTPGRQQYHPSACKGWASWTEITTSALLASYNIGSLTDNGTGDTTLTYTISFSSVNYSFTFGVNGNSAKNATYNINQDSANAPTASAIRINTYFSAYTLLDYSKQCVHLFGDQ